MNFYETHALEEGKRKLRQGDILSPVPFLGFSITDAAVLAPGAEDLALVDLTQNVDRTTEVRLVANVDISAGIVLNQSCDLSDNPKRERPILVARIESPKERGIKVAPENAVKKNVDTIRELSNPGKHPSVFYLPEYESANFKLAKSVVDLLEVTSFPPNNFAALSRLAKLRLSQPALQALQERLTYCFGRFGAPDHLYMNEEERKEYEERLARKGLA